MHTYAIAIPGRGLQNIVSLLSEDVVFAKGLVPQAVVGKLRKASSDGGTLTQANFVGNPAFVDFLHQVIAVHAPREAEFIAEAKRRVTGRVYVIDGRTATPQGDVPPWDVIGRFRVEDGIVTANSYEPNANHVLLSEQGFFRLTPWLQERLVAAAMACY